VTGALYQSGEFTREMTLYVWAILAAASVGLLPSTLGRLYSSAFYALHDTRTPLRIAIIRVSLGIALGYGLSLHLPGALGLDSRWGAAGITLASGLAAGVEYLLLRRALGGRIGPTRSDWGLLARLWLAAAAGVAAGWLVRAALPPLHPIPAAVLILGVFGGTYLGGAALLGVPQARRLMRFR
jgi:putative peptidoglycan lipid II flippase